MPYTPGVLTPGFSCPCNQPSEMDFPSTTKSSTLRSLFIWGCRHLYISRITRYSAALLVFILIWLMLDIGNLFPTFAGFIIAWLSLALLALFLFVDVTFLLRRTLFQGQRRPMRRTDTAIVLFVLLPLYLATKVFIHSQARVDLGFDIHQVVTDAMAPTLFKTDYVLTDTRAYRRTSPVPGDIVQVRYSDTDYIRRVRSASDNGIWLSTDASAEQNYYS